MYTKLAKRASHFLTVLMVVDLLLMVFFAYPPINTRYMRLCAYAYISLLFFETAIAFAMSMQFRSKTRANST